MSKPDPQETGIHSVEHLLAHALAMEVEAVERYESLADQMETHNNREVAALFRKLAEIEKLHVDNVNDISEGHTLPHIAPWEYSWEAPESPEAPSVSAEGLHYMMHPYHAISMALEAERRGSISTTAWSPSPSARTSASSPPSSARPSASTSPCSKPGSPASSPRPRAGTRTRTRRCCKGEAPGVRRQAPETMRALGVQRAHRLLEAR